MTSSSSLLSLGFKRLIQSQVHPQKFIRILKLTDGSLIRVSTLTAPPQNETGTVTLMNLDSANHPSWNPELRDRILLDDRGQVAKFRAKYAAASTSDEVLSGDYGVFLDSNDPNLNISGSQNQLTKEKVKPKGKAQEVKKKKK